MLHTIIDLKIKEQKEPWHPVTAPRESQVMHFWTQLRYILDVLSSALCCCLSAVCVKQTRMTTSLCCRMLVTGVSVSLCPQVIVQAAIIGRHSSGWRRNDLFVCWLLNVPATCECISGTDLLRQFYVLPHWDRSCRSNFPSHSVTVCWHPGQPVPALTL